MNLDEKQLYLQNTPSAREMIRLIVAALSSPQYPVSMSECSFFTCH